MRGCSDNEAALVRLVSQPHVVEVLDTLEGRPMTHRELCRVLRVFRRPVTEALRALAACGAIRRTNHQGSWDGRDPEATRYELTGAGHGILEVLQHIAVWEAIYERFLHSHPEVGQVKRSGRDGR